MHTRCLERRIAVTQLGDILVACACIHRGDANEARRGERSYRPSATSARLESGLKHQASAPRVCRNDACGGATSCGHSYNHSCGNDDCVCGDGERSDNSVDGGRERSRCATASRLVAIKRVALPLLREVKASAHTLEDPVQEIHVATKIAAAGHHANIVQYLDMYVADDCLHLVMEYCRGGDMLGYIERLGADRGGDSSSSGGDGSISERDALTAVAQVARALEFLHNRVGVAHRDVSLENIFVAEGVGIDIDADADGDDKRESGSEGEDDGREDGSSDDSSSESLDAAQRGCSSSSARERTASSKNRRSVSVGANAGTAVCKLGDFGLSVAATERPSECVGKLVYMAPEVVALVPYDPCRADVWSLGVTLFILLTGSPVVEVASEEAGPFRGFCRLGVRGVLRAWGMLARFRVETVDLCDAMLQVDPRRRLSIDGVLRHAAWAASGVAV